MGRFQNKRGMLLQGRPGRGGNILTTGPAPMPPGGGRAAALQDALGQARKPDRGNVLNTLPARVPTGADGGADADPWGSYADTDFAQRAQKAGFKDLGQYEKFRGKRGGENALGKLYDQAAGGGKNLLGKLPANVPGGGENMLGKLYDQAAAGGLASFAGAAPGRNTEAAGGEEMALTQFSDRGPGGPREAALSGGPGRSVNAPGMDTPNPGWGEGMAPTPGIRAPEEYFETGGGNQLSIGGPGGVPRVPPGGGNEVTTLPAPVPGEVSALPAPADGDRGAPTLRPLPMPSPVPLGRPEQGGGGYGLAEKPQALGQPGQASMGGGFGPGEGGGPATSPLGQPGMEASLSPGLTAPGMEGGPASFRRVNPVAIQSILKRIMGGGRPIAEALGGGRPTF